MDPGGEGKCHGSRSSSDVRWPSGLNRWPQRHGVVEALTSARCQMQHRGSPRWGRGNSSDGHFTVSSVEDPFAHLVPDLGCPLSPPCLPRSPDSFLCVPSSTQARTDQMLPSSWPPDDTGTASRSHCGLPHPSMGSRRYEEAHPESSSFIGLDGHGGGHTIPAARAPGTRLNPSDELSHLC